MKKKKKIVSCVCWCTGACICACVCVVKVLPAKSVIVHWTAHLQLDLIGCWLVLFWLRGRSLLWRKFHSLHLQPSTSFLITGSYYLHLFLPKSWSNFQSSLCEWVAACRLEPVCGLRLRSQPRTHICPFTAVEVMPVHSCECTGSKNLKKKTKKRRKTLSMSSKSDRIKINIDSNMLCK